MKSRYQIFIVPHMDFHIVFEFHKEEDRRIYYNVIAKHKSVEIVQSEMSFSTLIEQKKLEMLSDFLGFFTLTEEDTDIDLSWLNTLGVRLFFHDNQNRDELSTLSIDIEEDNLDPYEVVEIGNLISVRFRDDS